MTYFEDLSNEIFYEIFDFLDACDAYEAFYHLNNRFRQFFIHLSLPYKINLDLTSQTAFQQRFQHIKIGNIHHIISLRFSSWITVDLFLLSFSFDSSFIRLESLTLLEIKSQKLIPILMRLSSIPRLFSLSMTTIGTVKDPNIIHQLIFGLPVLKYCNTTFKWCDGDFFLSNSVSEPCTIEHFVSKSTYNLTKLTMLLSYMPRLVHLSVSGYISPWRSYVLQPVTLNNLTHFHLHHSMTFDEFESVMSNSFHRLQVLRISSNSNNNYLDSERWQRLISTHLPCLDTFDLQHFGKINNDDEHHLSRDRFNSSFWMKRKWLFACQYYHSKDTFYMFFYSQIYSSDKMNSNFIRDIVIDEYNTTIDLCSSQLTLSTTDDSPGTLFFDQLHSIIPFEHLRTLTVTSKHFDMDHVTKLLHLSPNIQVLTLSTYLSPRNNHNNNIQQIIIRQSLTFADVQQLINTFPSLKSLEMKIKENDLETIIRFLLKHNMKKNSRLYLVGLRDAHPVMTNRLQKILDREKLTKTYSIEFLSDTAYLRW